MRELRLPPEQIIVPPNDGSVNLTVLRIYYNLYRQDAEKYLPGVIVVKPEVALSGSQKFVYYAYLASQGIVHLLRSYDPRYDELCESVADLAFKCAEKELKSPESGKRELELLHQKQEEGLIDVKQYKIRLREVIALEKKFATAKGYALIDGNHRALAAALNHKGVLCSVLDEDYDLELIRDEIAFGQRADFYNNINKLSTARFLHGFMESFLEYTVENMEDDCGASPLETVKERADNLVSGRLLPDYMIEEYLSKK